MTKFAAVGGRLLHVLDEAKPMLRVFDEAAATQPVSPEKWSRKQVICHLLDSASNNHQRFLRATIQGELTFPGYAPDPMVQLQNPNALSWSFLVEFWANYNRYLAHVLAQIPDAKWDVQCHIGDLSVATLGWIAEDYVEHLKHHLNQVVGKKFESTYAAGA